MRYEPLSNTSEFFVFGGEEEVTTELLFSSVLIFLQNQIKSNNQQTVTIQTDKTKQNKPFSLEKGRSSNSKRKHVECFKTPLTCVESAFQFHYN